jgi:glycosyltransferase involved in cell wall biosynthesis
MCLIFWQNILSPHQAPFLRALAGNSHDVTVVAVESMTEDRLALGWVAPDMGQARVVVAPKDDEVVRLVDGSDRAAIHVIAGARWKRLGNLAAQQCLKSKRPVGIITEAPDPRGLAGYGRWVKYTTERYTTGSRFDFILAMGEMGVRWFRNCGYASEKVFPFAYVTEPAPAIAAKRGGERLGLLYVGQFIPRKGLDVLFRAFAALQTGFVELRLLGDGAERQRLQRLADELGIEDRIIWLAKSNAAGVQAEMTKADVTILASRHDGWGAVVNESLMVGTPVICSTSCGAAELIRQPWLGTVFHAGSVGDLAKALEGWIDRGPRLPAERERIRQWSQCISAQAVARYFVAIMEHVYSKAKRPMAPWRCDP